MHVGFRGTFSRKQVNEHLPSWIESPNPDQRHSSLVSTAAAFLCPHLQDLTGGGSQPLHCTALLQAVCPLG